MGAAAPAQAEGLALEWPALGRRRRHVAPSSHLHIRAREREQRKPDQYEAHPLHALGGTRFSALGFLADRARRGGSGALSLAIRSSEAEFPTRGVEPSGS